MTTPVSAERGRFNVVVFGPPGCGVRTLARTCFAAEPVAAALGPAVLPGAQVLRDPDDVVELQVMRTTPLPGAAPASGPGIGVPVEVWEALDAHLAATDTFGSSDQLHSAWFVLRWGTGDLTDAQMSLLADVAERLPVVLVVTQVPANLAGRRAREAVAFARRMDALMLPALGDRPVLLTNALALETSGVPVHGIAELRAATFAIDPEAAARARVAAAAASRRRRAARMRTVLPDFLTEHVPEHFGNQLSEQVGEQWDRVTRTSRSAWNSAWQRYRPR